MPEIVDLPYQETPLVFNEYNELSPTWVNYDSAQLTIGGTTSAKSAGTYVATFTPNANYMWSDGTTETKSVTWIIEPMVVSIPTPTEATYEGEPLQFIYYCNIPRVVLSNIAYGSISLDEANAPGIYNITANIGPNFVWSDGTSVTTLTWVVN